MAEHLGLPHPIDGATAVLATTKTRQRERFASAGVLQPQTFSTTDPAIPFPCVVKAPDRQGQRGLTLVLDRSGLAAAVEAAKAESRGGVALVEELIDGPEVTVNAVSVSGVFTPLTVTDRLLAEPPAFGVALAHAWPSAHETEGVIEAARAAVEALGITNGPTYTQLRLGSDGRAYVVEVAARLGGGHDAELCKAALGVDLNDLAISFALGEPCDDVSQGARAGGACVLFLVAPEGVLRAIEGVRAGGRDRRGRMGQDLPAAGMGIRATAARRRPGRGDPGDRSRSRRRARAGPPCGGDRTLPCRCAPRVAPGSASSLPRSERRRSPPSARRSARAG